MNVGGRKIRWNLRRWCWLVNWIFKLAKGWMTRKRMRHVKAVRTHVVKLRMLER